MCRETYTWSIFACELERPPHTHTKRERDGEKGRGTNKNFVLDACDRIEDCRRERERETSFVGDEERNCEVIFEWVVFIARC